MKKKHIIVTLAVVACIAIGVGGKYYLKKTDMQSKVIGREEIKSSLKEEFNLKKGLENLTITLNVNNIKSKEDLKVAIKNPKGHIVDTFEVNKSNKKNYEKKFAANEGKWTVDFIGEKEKVNYNYNLDWYGDNK